MECYRYLRNIQNRLFDGKTPYERRFWCTIWRTEIIPFFIGWESPHIHERSVKNPSIWKESTPSNFPRLCIVRGWRNTTSTEVDLYLKAIFMTDVSGSYAVFSEQGSSASFQMTAAKDMDVFFMDTRLRRTSSGRSGCSHWSQNGRCSKIVENSFIGMSRHLDTSTTTQMA